MTYKVGDKVNVDGVTQEIENITQWDTDTQRYKFVGVSGCHEIKEDSEEVRKSRKIAEEYAFSNNCSIVSNEYLKDLRDEGRKVVRYETATFLERLVYLFTKEV